MLGKPCGILVCYFCPCSNCHHRQQQLLHWTLSNTIQVQSTKKESTIGNGSFANHQPIMSHCQWSCSDLEHQQSISLALCPSVLLDDIVRKSSGDKGYTLSDNKSSQSSSSSSSSNNNNNSNSITTSTRASSMSFFTGSDNTRSELSDVSNLDSTSIIYDSL